MKREFFSATRQCPLGCKYCFAAWEDYTSPPSLNQPVHASAPTIVYPTCDGDQIVSHAFLQRLQQLCAGSTGPIVFSISTKWPLTAPVVSTLREINETLQCRGNAFLKVGVSISGIECLPEIEPRAATYAQRLESLRLLAEAGLPRSVSLKPLLPFVEPQEYVRIVDDTCSVADCYLTGDLYVDRSSDFYKAYLDGKYPLAQRPVEWLPHRPVWDFVDMTSVANRIASYVRSLGAHAFDSDATLVGHMYSRCLRNQASFVGHQIRSVDHATGTTLAGPAMVKLACAARSRD